MQGLYKKMDVLRPRLLSNTTMTRFHSDEYIDFLKCVTPDNMSDHKEKLQRFGLGEANPIFDGLFEYCQLYTSGSIAGAQRLNSKMCNTAINWSGGMHNAKASEASGFGYVNDCVLSILGEYLRLCVSASSSALTHIIENLQSFSRITTECSTLILTFITVMRWKMHFTVTKGL